MNQTQSKAMPHEPTLPVSFRRPLMSDGAAVWELIAESGALDQNSLYCNLLQCSHFAQTCVIAQSGDALLGWMSGYIPPEQPGTMFVWQVCAAPAARGQGLARRMLHEVLSRPECGDVTRLSCTITKDNAASWALFNAVARDLGAPLAAQPHFLRQTHFNDLHDSEHQVIIGPFARGRIAQKHAA